MVVVQVCCRLRGGIFSVRLGGAAGAACAIDAAGSAAAERMKLRRSMRPPISEYRGGRVFRHGNSDAFESGLAVVVNSLFTPVSLTLLVCSGFSNRGLHARD